MDKKKGNLTQAAFKKAKKLNVNSEKINTDKNIVKPSESSSILTKRYFVDGRGNLHIEYLQILETHRLNTIESSFHVLKTHNIINTNWKLANNKKQDNRESIYHIKWKVWWEMTKNETIKKAIAFDLLCEFIKDEDSLKAVINERRFSNPALVQIVNAGGGNIFSTLRIFIRESVKIKSEEIEKSIRRIASPGAFNKKKSDQFANQMGEHLNEAREALQTSTRQLARYFNAKKIPSALGGTWTPSSVAALIRRRQKLNLENREEVAAKNKKRSNLRRNYGYDEMMGVHLDHVRNEGHKSTRKIADRFNELGVTTKKGVKWSNVTVHKLLKRRQEFGLE